jgi:hypothetical protein
MFKGKPKTEYHGDHFFLCSGIIGYLREYSVSFRRDHKNPKGVIWDHRLHASMARHLQVFWLQHQHYE